MNKTTNPLIDAALAWLGRGVMLVPLQFRSKRLVRGFGAHLRKVTTPGEAFYFWEQHAYNLGLVCGGLAGLVVLDFDQAAAYYDWRDGAGDLAQTYTVATHRGFHVYMTAGNLPSFRSGLIEVKGAGSVVTAVPSVHPCGLIYRPLVPDAPILVGDAELSLLSKKAPAQQVAPCQSKVGEAGRDDLLARIKAAWPALELAKVLTKLKSRDGRWYHGLCPFHSETTPSFWVDAERGTFGCFACEAHGDAINLFAKLHGLTVQDAIKEMARKLPR